MNYQFGNIKLDTDSYRLERDGTALNVEPQVFDLLIYLIENRSRVVTREELLDQLWKGRIVSDSAINSRLKALRKVVGDNGRQQKIIKTIHRRGYQFVGQITGGDGRQVTPQKSVPMQSALFNKPSIAVLPFENLCNEKDRYFVDGLSKDIIANLSRYRDLLVIHHESTFLHRLTHGDFHEESDGLGVQYLASGSVRKAGNLVRIDAQLVELNSRQIIWGESFERVYEDLFSLEDEVASKIAMSLAGRVESESATRAARKTPESMGAYDYFLRARQFDESTAYEDLIEERKLLAKAIELDPLFANAFAQMACSYVRESETEECELKAPVLEKAVGFARQAVSLDEYNSFAHMSLGWAYINQHKFDLSETHLDRAIECNPNEYDAYCIKSWLLAMTGRGNDVLFCGSRALQLNPLAPDTCLIGITSAYYSEENYQAALDLLGRIKNPGYHSEALRAACLAQLGHEAESNVAAQRSLKLGGNFMRKRNWLFFWPFKNDKDLEHLVSGFVKAGIMNNEEGETQIG